jgi:hypothetical protein
MNTKAIVAISAGAGLAVGGAAGYFIALNVVVRSYAKVLDDEIRKDRQHYQALIDQREAELQAQWNPQVTEEEAQEILEDDGTLAAAREFMEGVTNDLASRDENPTEPTTRRNIRDQAVTEEEAGPQTLPPQDIRTVTEEFVPRVSNDTVFLITDRDFSETEEDFDKIRLTYWEEDDTLSDSEGGHIPDPEVDKLIGRKHLDQFGVDSGNEDVVYVRNMNNAADYEISRNPNAWVVEIGGLSREEAGLAEPKARPARMRSGDE